MNKLIFTSLVVILLFRCASSKTTSDNKIILKQELEHTTLELSDTLLKEWFTLDIVQDSIGGVSLNKAYNQIIKIKKGQSIVVAVIDTEMDINHTDLKKNIWFNDKEIPNNNIDDDGNNYVDDINGWNFLGNLNGGNITEANKEYVRIFRFYNEKFKDIDSTNLTYDEITSFEYYKNFKNRYFRSKERLKRNYELAKDFLNDYLDAKKALKNYFPDGKYSFEVLNKVDTVGNGLAKHVNMMRSIVEYNDNDASVHRSYRLFENKFKKRGNVDFNERDILDEDENDIRDIGYGNNKLVNNLDIYKHATKVAGVIKEDFIKIMPLAIAPYGDTHDKDIALAIRYAVDNGAKVINMSFGKDYSLHKEWVFEALKYAEKHNVLIVSSAGNSLINLDEITTYPNDHDGNGVEVSDNFLMVGGSTRKPNENLYYIYSNYGKTTVDIFAPAAEIYTTIPNNGYITDTGTSLAAALTSKVAALLFSHYPNLTASQVKHIIMDSGVEYTFPVKTPTRENKDKMTPFNELSKSGKIVNAYNALIMADSISKKKKLK